MIITCPACATRYAVPDSAIGIEGRTVRCAKCRHSWFQDGPVLEMADLPPPPPAQEPVAPPPAAPVPVAQAPVEQPPVAPPVAPPQFRPREADTRFEAAPSSFAHEPPFRPRRNPAKMWTALAVGFALVTTASMAAVAKFGLPDWLPLPQASNSQPDLKLEFPASRQERRPLANGNDFFNISGTITNVGQSRRSVPALMIVLRDSRQRAVFTVEADPPKPVLAPGETIAINTAIVDAPKAAVAATVQWKQP